MTKQGKLCVAGLFYVLWLALIVLLCLVDRAPVGPDETVVGLAKLNVLVFKATGVGGSGGSGVRMGLYKLTEYLGYLSILVACLFAFVGAGQLFRRRSLRKVDKQILGMGVLFIAAIVLYVFFEKVVVNCRPVILPDETGPSASFPSSHTVLVCVIMGSTAMALRKYVHNEWLRILLRLVCVLLIIVMVLGRLLCGCHWFTDILGGVLVSIAMLALYDGVVFGSGEDADGA